MSRRAIKTIGDVRELLIGIIPPGMHLWCSYSTSDSRSRSGAHHSERFSASLNDENYKEVIDVDAPTAADLYRNFTTALNEWRKPRRLAAPPPARPMPPATDEHDNVRATGGPRRIAAIVVQRRLLGPGG